MPKKASKRKGSSKPAVDVIGSGGEVHQGVEGGAVLTTAVGAPLSDHQNSLRAGQRGPTPLEDFAMREKIFHFDHERIPERVVHARGYGDWCRLPVVSARIDSGHHMAEENPAQLAEVLTSFLLAD